MMEQILFTKILDVVFKDRKGFIVIFLAVMMGSLFLGHMQIVSLEKIVNKQGEALVGIQEQLTIMSNWQQEQEQRRLDNLYMLGRTVLTSFENPEPLQAKPAGKDNLRQAFSENGVKEQLFKDFPTKAPVFFNAIMR